MAAGRVRSPCLPRDYDKNSRSALAGRAPIDPECVRNGRIGIGAGGRREPSDPADGSGAGFETSKTTKIQTIEFCM